MLHPKYKRICILVGLSMLLLPLFLASCSQEPVEVTRIVQVPGDTVEVEVPGEMVEVEVTRVVMEEVMVEPETAMITVPFEMAWAESPHADAAAEAFVHWDEDDPAEVPTSCAKCHSTPGLLRFPGR